MKDQCEQLLEGLKNGPMTTGQIRNTYGIGMPAPRVFELRQLGYDIRTELVTVTCRGQRQARVAKYILYNKAGRKWRRAA